MAKRFTLFAGRPWLPIEDRRLAKSLAVQPSHGTTGAEPDHPPELVGGGHARPEGQAREPLSPGRYKSPQHQRRGRSYRAGSSIGRNSPRPQLVPREPSEWSTVMMSVLHSRPVEVW